MHILLSFGTRPEWLKIKPLLTQFKKSGISYSTVFTGQHKDLLKSVRADFVFEQQELCSNRLNSVLAQVLVNTLPSTFTHVLVQGDTTSALGMCLWAFHNRIKIIHLEAGLRTYDLDHPYPEEANRQIISRLANIHFCATKLNKKSLLKEQITNKQHIYVVGNTVLDNIVNVVPTYENKVLVTLHRRENHNIISEWFETIDYIAKINNTLNFILPIHPNPNVVKYKSLLKHVKVVEPLEYTDLIEVLKTCKFVITDSGGIQEEASFLNKKIIICRKTTERTECLKTHGILCGEPKELLAHVDGIKNNYIITKKCPFGSGNSSKKISTILKQIWNN
jgi:UDP-N-acetylglucosamine 2-epimerase (non-hydrolysing)